MFFVETREPFSAKIVQAFMNPSQNCMLWHFLSLGGKYQKTIRSKPFFKLNHFQQHSKQKRWGCYVQLVQRVCQPWLGSMLFSEESSGQQRQSYPLPSFWGWCCQVPLSLVVESRQGLPTNLLTGLVLEFISGNKRPPNF